MAQSAAIAGGPQEKPDVKNKAKSNLKKILQIYSWIKINANFNMKLFIELI